MSARGAAAFALAALLGCGERSGPDAAPAVGAAQVHLVSTVNDDPGSRVELVVDPGLGAAVGEGVSVRVGPDGAGRALGQRVTIRGREVAVAGDELRVGERSYGPLEGPVRIHVRADGVYVNDELRGALDP